LSQIAKIMTISGARTKIGIEMPSSAMSMSERSPARLCRTAAQPPQVMPKSSARK
jgi:hypothetical protein